MMNVQEKSISIKLFQIVAILALILVSRPDASHAQVGGISYTLSPIGKYVFFNGDAGLKDGLEYGGELGFGFGRFLELDGVYLMGNGFETDYSDLSSGVFASSVGDAASAKTALEGLNTRKFDLSRYGAKLRINIGNGRLIPFITAGTGVQQFKADGVKSSEQIYTNVGAGLTFSVATRYTLSIGAENLTYRYNPGSALFSEADLAATSLTRESFDMVTVNNPVVSTSLKIFLGGRSGVDLTDTDRALLNQFKGGRFRLALEPFYGQINFNSALGFPDSRAMTGINAGFDLGPYVGLRGFYWRDTDQETAFEGGLPGGFGDLSMYGGELDLRFGGNYVTPYLIVGGGYMDMDKKGSFTDVNNVVPSNRYFAMGGAGVEIPLLSSVSLQGGVRGLFMSTEDIQDVNGPSSVFGSLMYSAGISFNLGGRKAVSKPKTDPRPVKEIPTMEVDPLEKAPTTEEVEVPVEVVVVEGQPVEVTPETDAEKRIRLLEDELKRAIAKLDSLQNAPVGMEKSVEIDSVKVVKGYHSNISDRTMTIPVPEVGEIYIRFGASKGHISVDSSFVTGAVMDPADKVEDTVPPATVVVPDSSKAPVGITPNVVYEIVQKVLAEQEAKNAEKEVETGITAEQLEKSLKEMENRLDKRISNEIDKVRDAQEAQANQEKGEAFPAVPADTSAQKSNGLFAVFADRQLNSIIPVVGLRLKDGIDRVVLGARADYRFPDQKIRFLPEVALTIGDAVGLSALANVAWYPYSINENTHLYAGTGAGLVSNKVLSGLELKLNLFAGVEYKTKTGATFFGEFSTLDFFDYNRIMFGYRILMDK